MDSQKPGKLRMAVEKRKEVLINQLYTMGISDSNNRRFHEMTLTELEEIYQNSNSL